MADDPDVADVAPPERLAFDQALPPGIVVQALCRPLLRSAVNLNIHSDDEMLYFFLFTQGYPLDQAAAIYFESGRLLWRTLRQLILWRFGSLARVRLLDFASGYGRVTRHIVAEVPPDQVWVSDIYAGGVAFQKRQLAVHGVVSTSEPEDIDLPGGFDCILVSSLFTHLPAARFSGWLQRLGRALAPGGLLLFSVHDLSTRPGGASPAAPQTGLVFEAQSESGSLTAQEYGTAWVSEDFVRGAVAAALAGAEVHRIPRGLGSFQDLYVVLAPAGTPAAVPTAKTVAAVAAVADGGAGGVDAAGPRPDFSALRLRRVADGFIEHCSRQGRRRLLLAGWIGDRVTGQPPREVRAVIDGRLVSSTGEFTPRSSEVFAADPTSVVGWQLTADLPPEADADHAQLAIAAIASDGEEIELLADSILGALLRSAQVDVFLLHQALERERTQAALHTAALETCQAEAARNRAELEGRVAHMEASRFWKLRNLWWSLKRKLGLIGNQDS